MLCSCHNILIAWSYKWLWFGLNRSTKALLTATANFDPDMCLSHPLIFHPPPYVLISRSLLKGSLLQSRLLLTHLNKSGIPVHWHGREEGEPAPCCNNCMEEVFNILFVLNQRGEYLVYCHKCASAMKKSFTVLQQVCLFVCVCVCCCCCCCCCCCSHCCCCLVMVVVVAVWLLFSSLCCNRCVCVLFLLLFGYCFLQCSSRCVCCFCCILHCYSWCVCVLFLFSSLCYSRCVSLLFCCFLHWATAGVCCFCLPCYIRCVYQCVVVTMSTGCVCVVSFTHLVVHWLAGSYR